MLVPDTAERAVGAVGGSSNDLPLLEVSRPVRLQFEGWPAVHHRLALGGGRVTFWRRGGAHRRDDDGAGKFQVLVRPNSEEAWLGRVLRQGVPGEGWVLLDSVRLGELWRRFTSFPRRR